MELIANEQDVSGCGFTIRRWVSWRLDAEHRRSTMARPFESLATSVRIPYTMVLDVLK